MLNRLPACEINILLQKKQGALYLAFFSG